MEWKEYQCQEDEHWASRKEELFRLEEFYDLLGAKATPFLEKRFQGVVAQFKEAGYPPEGATSDFLDLQRVLNDIPNEDIP